MEIKVTTDKSGIDLILKGLRLIRVYQEREMSWITPMDKDNAKLLTDKIEKGIRGESKSKKAEVFTENPKCDPDANCDW
tara:strand:- start:4106 stop:4342 length:237 start_codon:yes stop_codon:yes gene_type:complete